jgi:hypothetical protein
MATSQDPGPLRKVGLYLGLVEPEERGPFVAGGLTRFQLQMWVFYLLLTIGLWVLYVVQGGRGTPWLALFWTLNTCWFSFVAVRRARRAPTG